MHLYTCLDKYLWLAYQKHGHAFPKARLNKRAQPDKSKENQEFLKVIGTRNPFDLQELAGVLPFPTPDKVPLSTLPSLTLTSISL